jgi:hypothetical protein
MKNCAYCGWQNTDIDGLCVRCGTELIPGAEEAARKGKYFWNRPLKELAAEKAAKIAKKLPRRKCLCGQAMIPKHVEIATHLGLYREHSNTIYACNSCGKHYHISTSKMLGAFGLALFLLPFLIFFIWERSAASFVFAFFIISLVWDGHKLRTQFKQCPVIEDSKREPGAFVT